MEWNLKTEAIEHKHADLDCKLFFLTTEMYNEL